MRKQDIAESVIKAMVLDACKRNGLYSFAYFPGPFGAAGIPDRLVILPGGVLFGIECKRYGRDLTPMQKVRKKELRAAGVRVVKVSDGRHIDRLIRTYKKFYQGGETTMAKKMPPAKKGKGGKKMPC